MKFRCAPGIFVKKVSFQPRSIRLSDTTTTAFIDVFACGPIDQPTLISSQRAFDDQFGGIDERSEASYAIHQFFRNGGVNAVVTRVAELTPTQLIGSARSRTGLATVAGKGLPEICFLSVPAAARLASNDARAVYERCSIWCQSNQAMLILDTPANCSTVADLQNWSTDSAPLRSPNTLVYFPHLSVRDPIANNAPRLVASSGVAAGIIARTTIEHSLAKTPAGPDASLVDAEPAIRLSAADCATLTNLAVNPVRSLPKVGACLFGGRVFLPSNASSDWTYLAPRRMALAFERSITAGLKWAVFEPNDEPLWANIRQPVEAFLYDRFRDGWFAGAKQTESFFVKCGRDTTTPVDIANGIVNLLVGFAPLKPAEFVIIRISQKTAN